VEQQKPDEGENGTEERWRKEKRSGGMHGQRGQT